MQSSGGSDGASRRVTCSANTSFGVANIALSRLNHDLHNIHDVAEGAFGVVKCALLDADGQVYAVKESKKAIASEGDLQQRLQEVYALCACNHPHVLRYYDAWVENRSLYVLTEWMNGGTAAQLPRPLAEVHVRALLHQMSCALHHMHTRGMVHHDVKPDNILVHMCAPDEVSNNNNNNNDNNACHDRHIDDEDEDEDDVTEEGAMQSTMLFKLCDFGLSRRRAAAPPSLPLPSPSSSSVSPPHAAYHHNNNHYNNTSDDGIDDDGDGAYGREDEEVCSATAVATRRARRRQRHVCSVSAAYADDGDRDYLSPEILHGVTGAMTTGRRRRRRGRARAAPALPCAHATCVAAGDVEHDAEDKDDSDDSDDATSMATTTAAADVYALGATCVTLMGGSALAVREGVYTGAFATHSPSLQALLRAMTAHNPRTRPSALEVAVATLPTDVQTHAALQHRRATLDALHARMYELDEEDGDDDDDDENDDVDVNIA